MMPVQDLIRICRKHNILILVDGAHTPGQVKLSLETLGADFFVGEKNMDTYECLHILLTKTVLFCYGFPKKER